MGKVYGDTNSLPAHYDLSSHKANVLNALIRFRPCRPAIMACDSDLIICQAMQRQLNAGICSPRSRSHQFKSRSPAMFNQTN